MSEQTVRSAVGQKTLPDYLQQAAYLLYVAAGVVFVVGLYLDVASPDVVVVSPLVIAQDPTNSGLFILATVILGIGYVTSKTGHFIQERRIEEIDQTQEWTVDIGNN
jgi:Na+-transporting methylmalonyl-CoA/oxaloacetate decarboxylase gamma subunit